MATRLKRIPLAVISRIGVSREDSQDIRLQKSLLVAGSLMFISAGALWGVAYILLGEWRPGLIPLFYAFVSLISVVHFQFTRRYRFFRASQLALILVLPFILMLTLGGFINSSAVILWSLICPMGALLFAEYRQAPKWQLAYLALLILSGLLEPYLRQDSTLSRGVVIAYFVLNVGAVSTIVFVLLHYFVGQRDLAFRMLHDEQERSEALLLNMLPSEIAARLKAGEKTIADYHPSVSILFADLVGFTPLATELTPAAVVEVLNGIYSHFDSLIDAYGVEKIQTIGDSYMIASGLPRPRSDHAVALARLALKMIAYTESLPPIEGRRLSFRIGISSGPVVAGVIGRRRFSYDVWGDTVNTASRMESQGQPGRIQVSSATYELIRDEFIFEPQGPIAVKGKGVMDTWFLVEAQQP